MATPVAFSAYPSTTKGYDSGSIVQFDAIVTNSGSSYNPDFGVFQCPSNGIYLFSISLLTETGRFMGGAIMQEGLNLLSSRSEGENLDQGAVVVVTECLELETVWVECTEANGELFGDRRSSFSGILITPY